MNIKLIRTDFPALSQKVNGSDLVYFDNAATALKPKSVIDSVSQYYSTINSNVHRAGHHLSAKATEAYENARSNVASFINADSKDDIVFTSGTTDSINLLSTVLEQYILEDGDEIILTKMEHHSNIVPWVGIKERKNINITVIDIDSDGVLNLEQLENSITPKTKIIAFSHSSNVLGTINPAKKIIEIAKKHNILTVVDGAQYIVHSKVDVKDLDCDFYCFSGHKLYAPMGIGVLYGKKELLEKMPPYRRGGGMIRKVSFDNIDYNDLPYKYEAGTPNVGGAVGLSKAIEYIEKIGFDAIEKHEAGLLKYATEKLEKIEGIEIYGKAKHKDPIVSFNVKGIHHFDIGMLLDNFGIATRTGHHCTHPLMDYFEIDGTVRVSFSFYNTREEIDYFVEKLKLCINMLS